MDTMWKVLTRKKTLDPVSAEQSELGRILNTFDLTALGVGSTLGVGVYVLAGHVARDTAGPAVVLSFLIATVASVFAGLCYAEFGARAPRAGSAYIYSYVCVGEFVAFIIGWNLILEYVIGSASVARGLSTYLDSLLNDTLKNAFIDVAPMHVSFMSAYFDFFAFGVSLLLATALAFGLKESSWVNNIFTLLNLGVVIFVVIAGGINAKSENWHLPKPQNTTVKGDGGFFPFGVEGMIKGAATCFYGFVGFDCIATTGEEVKNPKRAIPLAIVMSLFIIFLAYFGTSTVVTLMLPYYDQDPDAPLPHAFAEVGWYWAKWVVAIGGIFGLCASLFGAMFPLPRIIYAMASDSLVFRFLGKVSPRFKTPVVGTLLAGLLTGLMAALFELKQLVNMMSIGTLMAYTIVAASVLLLRYENERKNLYQSLITSFSDSDDSETYTENRELNLGLCNEDMELMNGQVPSPNIFKQIFNCGRNEFPSEISEKLIKVEVCLYCFVCILIGLCAMYLKEPIAKGEIWAIVLTSIVVALAILLVMSMTTQPKSPKELSFKVPLVPLIPALSILINIYLMLMLDTNTWIRFGVWMAVGIPTYYFSVNTHSDARNESICSRDSSIKPNGKLNGYANHEYVPQLEDITEIGQPRKKQPAPPPPQVIEVIAKLDEILEQEEQNIIIRKSSVDSISTTSNVLREENVQADVHCSDIPVTPIQEAPPLLQSSDVAASPQVEHPSSALQTGDVTASPDVAIDEARGGDEEHEAEPLELPPDEINSGEAPPPDLMKSEDEPISEPVIPPPPPFKQLSEKGEVDFPKPTVRLSALTSATLKHVEKPPQTPPVDYSRENSVVSPDHNLKFGTQEYKEFLEQLNQTLEQGYVPTQVVVDLKKKPVPKHTEPLQNEDVIEDMIDRKIAKEKLAQFLERTNSLPLMGNRNVNESKWNGVRSEEKQVNLSDLQEQHRQNMQNIFRSVRLRKEDSFKGNKDEEAKENFIDESNGETPEDEKEKETNDKNSDRSQHKENMDNILKSIRLRKVDSFKSNDESH